MNVQLEEIREQQRASWNQYSGAWKKWNAFTMKFLQPMGDAIINKLNIQETDTVLDIASGTGEPSLTIATLAKKGNVIATDISEQMMEIAKANAAEKGLTNFKVQTADVCDLPFENDSFNKLSCRMGFMFFPDMQVAATEMYRVLRTGGKMATAVWGRPENNPWITIMMSTVANNFEMPQPPPDAPGMFRCAKPGLIKELLQKAGFKNVEEYTINGEVEYTGADEYWLMMNEIAPPVKMAMSKADEPMKEKIKKDVFVKCTRLADNGKLSLAYEAYIVSGDK